MMTLTTRTMVYSTGLRTFYAVDIIIICVDAFTNSAVINHSRYVSFFGMDWRDLGLTRKLPQIWSGLDVLLSDICCYVGYDLVDPCELATAPSVSLVSAEIKIARHDAHRSFSLEISSAKLGTRKSNKSLSVKPLHLPPASLTLLAWKTVLPATSLLSGPMLHGHNLGTAWISTWMIFRTCMMEATRIKTISRCLHSLQRPAWWYLSRRRIKEVRRLRSLGRLWTLRLSTSLVSQISQVCRRLVRTLTWHSLSSSADLQVRMDTTTYVEKD